MLNINHHFIDLSGRLKMQDRKLQDRKMQDLKFKEYFTGLENAGDICLFSLKCISQK